MSFLGGGSPTPGSDGPFSQQIGRPWMYNSDPTSQPVPVGPQPASPEANPDDFWTQVDQWLEDPSGYGAVAPFLDYYTQIGATPPQFNYPGIPQGGAMVNPGAQTLRGLLQAIVSGGGRF